MRELQNALQYATIKARGQMIGPRHLPPALARLGDHLLAPARPPRLSREAVEGALREAGGNRVKAARLLGISRATLYRFLSGLTGGETFRYSSTRSMSARLPVRKDHPFPTIYANLFAGVFFATLPGLLSPLASQPALRGPIGRRERRWLVTAALCLLIFMAFVIWPLLGAFTLVDGNR